MAKFDLTDGLRPSVSSLSKCFCFHPKFDWSFSHLPKFNWNCCTLYKCSYFTQMFLILPKTLLTFFSWPKFDEGCWNYHIFPVHWKAVFILQPWAKKNGRFGHYFAVELVVTCLSLEIRYYLTCEFSCILCPNFEKFCPNNGQFFSVGDATACPATPCRTFMCNCQCWTRSGFQIAIQSDSAIQNRTGLDWILKKINRIRYGYPKLHWSLQYNASPEFFFGYKSDWIKYLDRSSGLGSDRITQWKFWTELGLQKYPICSTLVPASRAWRIAHVWEKQICLKIQQRQRNAKWFQPLLLPPSGSFN